MKLVVGARQSGKTIAAIKEAAASGSYLVVRSHKEACRVRDVAEKEGLRIPFPITFDEFLGGHFSIAGCRSLVIDGADEVLRRLAHGVPVTMATWDKQE